MVCYLISPKKRTDKFVLFAFLLFTANKSNSSVRFLGESTTRQSAFRFYLTFSTSYVHTLSGLGTLSKSLPIFGDFLTKKVIGRLEALSEVVTSKLSGLSVACIMGKTSRL